MANTPFELYEEAYRLHYRDKKIPDAVKIYEAIMREFPDSSECGYAFIQLQKIKANEITARLRTGRSRGSFPALVACGVSCLALLVAAGAVLSAFHEQQLERNRTTFAVASLAELFEGKDQEARKIVDEMKSFYPNDILARELSNCVAAGFSGIDKNVPEGTTKNDSSMKSLPAADADAVSGETPAKKNPSARRTKAAFKARAGRRDSHAIDSAIAPAASTADSSAH